MTIEVGRLCMKIASRDAGKECLVIDKIDNNHVMIDGNTRRRKCNIKHLEILPKTAKISKGANHADVMKALETLGISARKEPKKFAKPKSEKAETKKGEKKPKKAKRSLLKIIKKEKVEKPKEKPKKAAKKPAKKTKS